MSDPFTAASRPRRGVGVGAGPSSDPFAAASAATGGAGAWHAPAPNSLPRAPMAMRGAGDFEPMDAIGSMGSMSSTMPARSNAGAFAPAPAAPSAPAPFFDPAAALAAAGESGAALAANPVAMLAMHKGQELVASSMARYLPGAHALWTSLRLYFRVDNAYVRIKLGRTLFPFMHRRWARQPAAVGGGESAGTEGALAPPDADANAPDLYIPAMAFTSFVLLAGLARGVYGVRFDPEVLSTAMGRSTVLLLFEVAVLRGATYALSVPGVYALDLLALCGYKYVGMATAMVAHLVCWQWKPYGPACFYAVLAYTLMATFWFSMNTLMPVLRPDLSVRHAELDSAQKAQRNYLAIAAALLQCLIGLWLGWAAAG